MVDVLVILDGASEPLRDGEPTSLELARTPALDRLAREGELSRRRTVAAGLEPGSEAAIPALLGWAPGAPVDRGALEAAAYGIEVGDEERAWRVDVISGEAQIEMLGARQARPGSEAVARSEALGARQARPGRQAVALAAHALRAGAPAHEVHLLRGHRLLVVGRGPLPAAARASGLRAWPEGVVPPQILGPQTVLIGARGAAIGAARLMGARTIVPPGATGTPASDLAAKVVAAAGAIEQGAACVVVHFSGPDEAAHRRDRAAKIASIERADRELVGPLTAAVLQAGGTLTVCPDHGCDPATGGHDAEPVPSLTWSPAALHRELVRVLMRHASRRLTERAVADLPERALSPRRARAGAAA